MPEMEEIIQVEDRFYILASSPRVDDQTRVLKQGETFAVFNHAGDIHPLGLGEEGIYHEGTRHLSRWNLSINGRHPLLLSSTVREDNALLTVDLTNPDVRHDGQIDLPRDMVHVFRSCFLWQGACYTRLRIRSYALNRVHVRLELSFEADFADIFEVRGTQRERRGKLLEPEVDESRVRLAYRGLDGVVRRTGIHFDPAPAALSASAGRLEATLEPHGEQSYVLIIRCDADETGSRGARRPAERAEPFDQALQELAGMIADSKKGDAAVITSNEQFNAWLNRSAADLHLMVTPTAHGPYPYAGVPWFSTAFGRDGIITALEYLWVNPGLARGVLEFLAATQATEVIPEQDAEPGKILHETRRGEMAALGEIPFGVYYGTVDATPLFILLAGAYYRRTADRALIESIWPNVEAALQWIDEYGDADGDGFIEYARKASKGLVTQGWKDSWDSVFHADGRLADGPIALCEVQGYVYAAWRAAAELALVLGRTELAPALAAKASRLRERFEEAFWMEDLSTYALALDRDKRPCRVRASNAGHCLFTEIVDRERAPRVARTLLSNASFSGWGIRTVAAGEARYNPMGYHNGSVWPHDNALIAAGLANYDLKQETLDVLTGQFDASLFVELHRMPELFCGFPRRLGEGPTLYPVACAPQSWAAGAAFMLLESCLGLTIDAPRQQVRFRHPVLPESLQRITITNVGVGEASLDLVIERHERDVGINITRREGEVQVVVVK